MASDKLYALPKAKRVARRRTNRDGMVLIVVLLAVALLALGGYSFSDLMTTERKAARAQGKQIQSRAMAESGVELVMAALAEEATVRREAGGVYDNPGRFRAVLVADAEDAASRGYFTIVAPGMAEGVQSGTRYGLDNESTRLNLNAVIASSEAIDVGRDLLMALPAMTEDVADAILDWIDEDDEPREFGAEAEHYSGLTPAYGPRNGPIAAIDDLLLVRGVTPALLYGLDDDRNGLIDTNERNREAELGVDNSDGAMDFGWASYLTLHSAEANVRADGQPRIDLNAEDLTKLHADLTTALGAEQADFIIAYRQFGPYTGTKPGETSTFEIDLTVPAKTKLKTVLDLVGPRVEVKIAGDESTILNTPFPDLPGGMATYLPALLDATTINPAETIPGRININQASRAVLLGVPGMTAEQVEAIIAAREAEPLEEQSTRAHETWILSEEIVTLEEMKSLIPFVTASGSVYRATVVGYYELGGPMSRIEALIDGTTATPRLLAWRDLSHLGAGYTRAVLGAVPEP